MLVVLALEYDGSFFNGWQRQENVPSIQASLEQALAKLAGHPVEVVAAGRTDKGVHALSQYVHFVTSCSRGLNTWITGTNAYLPPGIRVWAASIVEPGFDARKSALARCYRYIIINQPIKPALLRHNLTWYYKPLDVTKMHLAAQAWVGEHDFSSFRASECQSRSPRRRLDSISVTRHNQYVIVEVQANAFLHHMVRNMVGVLLEIGSGKKPVIWGLEVLLAADRRQGAATAPPYGLYLNAVHYPSQWEIPSREGSFII